MKNNYPESLVRENEQLKKANEIMKLELQRLEEYNHQLRFDLNVMSQYLHPNETTGEEVWYWQNDGYDFSRSMRNDQAVLISAEDLRDILKNGEKISEEVDWWKKIPQDGILCWVWDREDQSGVIPTIIKSCEIAMSGNLIFIAQNGTPWKFARPVQPKDCFKE